MRVIDSSGPHPSNATARRCAAALLALLALACLALPAGAATPTVNGSFFGDGDLDNYLFLQGDTSGGSKGKIYYKIENQILYVALVVNKAGANDAVFADKGNSAADNQYMQSVGWSAKHQFSKLEGSDHASFAVECGATASTPDWEWALDLLYDLDGDLDPNESDWRGDQNGPDGLATSMPPSFVADTSIAWNMNNTSWDVTEGGTRAYNDWKSPDDPPLNSLTLASDYYGLNDDSTVGGNFHPGWTWEWSLVYEFSFDISSCTTAFSINPGTSHNSPSKDSINDTPWDPRTLTFDYGDLPDGPYATLNASNAAFHETGSVDNVFLGATVDNELEGQPNATATGDDNDLDGDDEDGVVFLTPLTPGNEADIQVTASGAGVLNAWIDFNSDGDFDDAGEQIASNLALAAGVNLLDDIAVPAGATGVMPSRFRITNTTGQGGDSPAGMASSGEVEDYMLASLGDLVWNDLDGDGVYEPDPDGIPNSGDEELGVPGAEVHLLSAGGSPIVDGNGTAITTTTDASGHYEFPGLPPGSYSLQFDLAAGYTEFTLQDAGGDDALDSDADPDFFGNGTEGLTGVYTLATGQVDDTVDAGMRAVTVALVTSAGAYHDRGGVVFEFSTGYEALTASFEVLRHDPRSGEYTPVHESRLPALMAPQGGVYRVLDAAAPPRQRLRYLVVEHQVDGRIQTYGPFTVKVGDRGDRGSVDGAVDSRPNVSPRLAGRLEAARREAAGRAAKAPARGATGAAAAGGTAVAALQVDVEEPGLYHLSAAELAAAFGVSAARVRQAINTGRLQLDNQGAPVAWHPAGHGGQGLYFFGRAIDSLYTRRNTYWVRLEGQGTRMQRVQGPVPGASPGGVFPSREAFENDILPAITATRQTEVDHWYWDGINAASSQRTRSFTLSLQDVAAGSAQLTVHLAGGSNGFAVYDHHVVVRVNGTVAGTAAWGGIQRHDATFSIDASLLGPQNLVEVEASLDEGSLASIVYIDGFDVTYPRAYRAVSDRLRVTGGDNSVITVQGLSTADALVLDLTNESAPVVVGSTRVELGAGGFQVSFEPAAADTPYLVTTASAARSGTGLRRVEPAIDLRDSGHAFEHVIVAPEAWRAAAERLAAHRSARGTSSLAVSFEDIVNQFSEGIETPWAIRDFLRHAHEHWVTAPQFVLLAGRGTLDPRDLLGSGDSVLPVVLVGTSNGLLSSDNVLADLVGDDAIPEVAMGRLPIVSAAELEAYVDKLEADAASTGPWRSRALMVADNPDRAGDFTAQSDSVAQVLASFDKQFVYLAQASPAAARAALLAAWNGGAQLVNYIGHGGVTQAAAEGLLRVSDMPALTNADRLPIVSALTCVVGRSDVPNLESLAEALVTDEDGGALAVWAPSGLSISGAAHALNLLYAQGLEASDPGTPLGTVVRAALAAFGEAGGNVDMLNAYGITGDPAVLLP